jgi:adenylate kinase
MSDTAARRGPRAIVLGKQGAGKGTQAALLATHYEVAHLSTGDLFRAAAADRTPAGLEAKTYMDRGDLVPDELVLRVVEDQFREQCLATKGFVLDGFPRTRAQAEALDELLADHPLDVVLDLDVPTEIVLHRIAGRRVCVNCGRLYHVDHPPHHDWSCDICGGHVLQRDDDNEDAVLRRLELYETQTLPLIQFYRRSGRLAHIDGTSEQDEVFAALVEVVRTRFDPERP